MSYMKDNPWCVQYQYTKQSTGDPVWIDWRYRPTKEEACVQLTLLAFNDPGRPLRVKNINTGEIL